MDRRAFLQVLGTGLAGLAIGTDLVRAPLTHARTAGPVTGLQALVATDQLNVRGGPGAGNPRVGSLTEGAAVDLLAPSADGGWWRVATDALVGYVDGQYLEPTEQTAASTAFDLDLVFPYAPQLTAVWCDPADLEMWLAYHQAVDVPQRERQQAIWSWELAHNAGFTVEQWNCSPYAVASAAHQWMPNLGFDHFHAGDAVAASRLLAWLLANPSYREPSVALIWRGAHYVLVRGVRAVGDPGQDATNARILGFYVADPNRGDPTWLGEDRFIPMDRWLGELFTPATYLTPHTGVPGDVWQNRYVTIQRDWTTEAPTMPGQADATPASYG